MFTILYCMWNFVSQSDYTEFNGFYDSLGITYQDIIMLKCIYEVYCLNYNKNSSKIHIYLQIYVNATAYFAWNLPNFDFCILKKVNIHFNSLMSDNLGLKNDFAYSNWILRCLIFDGFFGSTIIQSDSKTQLSFLNLSAHRTMTIFNIFIYLK